IGVIQEETAGQDVGGREIYLKPAEVAGGEAAGPILPVRQSVHRIVAVEGVETVMEPGAALDERTRELQARGPFVEVPAAIAGDAGNEIGAAETQPVVPHFGLEVEHARPPAAVFRGTPAGLDVHGLDRFDIEA